VQRGDKQERVGRQQRRRSRRRRVREGGKRHKLTVGSRNLVA
jgi:hypothetical protein